MRISTAYFAGVGTVIVAVAAGLGGGYFAANMANMPPAVSKLERRMSAEPISVAAAPAQPAPRVVVTSPAAGSAQEQQIQSEPQSQKNASAPSGNANPSGNAALSSTSVRVEEKPANNNVAVNNVAAVPTAQPAPQPAKSIESKSVEQAGEKVAAPRDAFAKAREADIKRAEAEKRRAERRQAWADRRRVQSPRDELEAVEERVREVTEPRRIRIREEGESREVVAEPVRSDMPRIRLFDRED